MTASTIITTYLGEGTHAARPAAPSVPTGGLAVYYETDTGGTFVYDLNGTAWVQVNSSTSALSLISTLTASNSASLAWTGLSSQTSWRLVGRLLVPATASIALELQVGTGAGPTYITTNYSYATNTVKSTGTTVAAGGTTANGFVCHTAGNNANSAPGISFDMTITTDNANYAQSVFTSEEKDALGNFDATSGGGTVAVSAAITAFKLIATSGNITSGTASLYSLSH